MPGQQELGDFRSTAGASERAEMSPPDAMSGSALNPTDLPTVVLTPADVEQGISPHLAELIDRFDPLAFEAGADATAWLQRKIKERSLPITTVLVTNSQKTQLCGFICMGFTAIALSADEQRTAEVGIVQRGQKVEDLCEPRLAANISWIARGSDTRKGFGQRLFDCAVNWAIDNRAIAMVVTPHDEETARKVWIGRFHFRQPRPQDQPDGAPSRLWYPVHSPEPIFQ